MTTLDEWYGNQETLSPHWQPRDGQLLGAEKSLRVRSEGRWHDVKTAPDNSRLTLPGVASRAYVPLLRATNGAQVLWSPRDGELLRLDRQQGSTWRLVPIRRTALNNVLDAVPDAADAALVATPRGLFRYRMTDGRVERLAVPTREHIVTAARDSLGRLWAAGDHLHLSLDEGRHWQSVSLPMMSPTETKRLRPNPASPGAMFLSLHDRGLVTIE